MSDGQYSIDDLKRAARKEAKDRAYAAGMNGEHGDGGAGTLRAQVDWYEKGERGEYPKEWEKYKRHIDPEYDEYVRLRKKFGD